MSTWFPPGIEHKKVAVGDLVAHDHMALRVLQVDPRDDGVVLLVRRERGPKCPAENDRQEFGFRTPFRSGVVCAWPDERMALCSCHGDPYPCRQMAHERHQLAAMRRDADLIAKAHDGHCLSCGELVTSRQGKVLAPEPNVLLPGFPAPLFHLRLSCRDGLNSYDRSRRARLGADWTPLLAPEPFLDQTR